MLQRRAGKIEDQRADAIRAIKRFETQGYKLNSASTEVVEAYMQMRSQFDRVDGKHLLAYMASKTTDLEQGAKAVISYWAVPKTNFPQGLPQDLLDAISTPEDLAGAQVIGGGAIDHGSNFILDMCAPRERLGNYQNTSIPHRHENQS